MPPPQAHTQQKTNIYSIFLQSGVNNGFKILHKEMIVEIKDTGI
jgi:hypothetical protein